MICLTRECSGTHLSSSRGMISVENSIYFCMTNITKVDQQKEKHSQQDHIWWKIQ